MPIERPALGEAIAIVREHFPGKWSGNEPWPAGWIAAPSLKGGDTHVADVRGWGYLTGGGHGALGLDGDAAVRIQAAIGVVIAEAVNRLVWPDTVSAATRDEADTVARLRAPITHEWLGSCGFKWHQHERQPHKHWVLKLGWAVDGGRFSTATDLYIEVSPAWWENSRGERVQAGEGDPWHCWIGGEGDRFIHVRHLQSEDDLTRLIEALTGLPWNPANVVYGLLRTPEAAAKLKAEWPKAEPRS